MNHFLYIDIVPNNSQVGAISNKYQGQLNKENCCGFTKYGFTIYLRSQIFDSFIKLERKG